MHRSMFWAAAALIVGMASPPANAQQIDRRDHRTPKQRGDRPAPGEAAVTVQTLRPKTGAPGTTVTIRGNGFLEGMEVAYGGRTVKPTSITPRAITFVVPRGSADGEQPVQVRYRRRAWDVGTFTMTRASGAPVAAVPDRRDRGDRDRRGDRPGRADDIRERRVNLHRERPMVTGFSPQSGKAGTVVTIRGRNLPKGAKLLLDNQEARAMAMTDNMIRFRVPTGKGPVAVALATPTERHPLVVGTFERDKQPEFGNKHWQDRRSHHQKSWQERRAKLAADEAARLEALRAREAELEANRRDRRAKHLANLRAQFEVSFLADPNTRAELALHAERTARLERMLRLAEANDMGQMVVRIEVAKEREDKRHERRMTALRANFSAQKGAN